MRFKYLKYLAFVLGGLSTVIATGALYLYATFDGARLAAELTHFAKQRYQRVLKFDGPLELSMFPRLALHLPALSLSGKNGEGEFIGVERATVSVRLLPLLARQVVVDQIEVDGLRMALQRGKDGKVSGADLFAGTDDNQPITLDVTRLAVHRGALSWADELTGRKLALAELNLNTGQLGRQADGQLDLDARLTQAAPAVDAHVQLHGAYRIDVDGNTQQARDVQLTVQGDLVGQKGVELEATLEELQLTTDAPPRLAGIGIIARGKADGEAVELKATAPHLTLSASGPEADAIEATLRVDGKRRNGALHTRLAGLHGNGSRLDIDKLTADVDWRLASGRLTGSLVSAASWQGGPRLLDAPALSGQLNYTPSRAGATPLKIAVHASARADLNRNSIAGKLDLQGEGSHIQGSWSLPRLSPLTLGFDVDVDRFKFDADPGDATGKKGSGAAASQVDFSALRGYEVDGVVRIGSLQAGGLNLERVRIPLNLHGGRLVSTAHSASLYGGSVEGSLTLAAEGNKLAYRAYLQNANAAPLLRDAIGKAQFAGTANLFVDVTSAGATTTELRAGLQGLARLRFRNGVVHGIDISAAMKEWRSLIPGRQTARRPHREAETTTFDEVTASFQIGKGIARNSDLQAKSGVFRVTGAGDIDLVESRIDYLSRVTLLVVPVGPDSGLLASLRGITVPIRVKGPLAAPEWHLEAALPTVSSAVSAGRAVVRSVVKTIPKIMPRLTPKPQPAPEAVE